MSKAPDLFSSARVAAPVGYHAADPLRDKASLVKRLKAAERYGLVNGMSKAQFARRYPRTLAPVTKDDPQ